MPKRFAPVDEAELKNIFSRGCHIRFTRGWDARAATSRPSSNLLRAITEHKLQFDELSASVIRQLLRERQVIHDKNRSRIADQITDITGEMSCCENLRYSVDAQRRKLDLEKKRAALEDDLRKQDTNLWKDTERLRRELVTMDKQHRSTRLRTGLLSTTDDQHEHKEEQDRVDSA